MVSGLVIAFTNLSFLDMLRPNPPLGLGGNALPYPTLWFRLRMAGGFSTVLSRRENARRISAVEGSSEMEIVGGVRVLGLLVESIYRRPGESALKSVACL